MSDTEQNQTLNDEGGSNESPNVKQMRESLERQKAENAQLRTATLHAAIRANGLDPENGPGALLAQSYKAESLEDLSPEKVQEYATEYGLIGQTPEPPPAENQLAPQAPPQQPLPGKAPELGGVPPAPTSPEDDLNNQIVQAQEAGDWVQAQRLRTEAYRRDRDFFKKANAQIEPT